MTSSTSVILLIRQPTESASEYPFRSKYISLGCQGPRVVVLQDIEDAFVAFRFILLD